MGSDAIPSAAASFPASRDAGKKKRNNRSAKLKQCKLDARREQWLSHVKGKGDCEVVTNVAKLQSIPRPGAVDINVKMREEVKERDELVALHENSNLDLCTNNSVLPRNREPKIYPRNSISSGSSIGSCSRSVSDMEEEETEASEESEVLDDWEAVADALSEDDRGSNCPDTAVPLLETASLHSMQSEGLNDEGTVTHKPHPIQGTPRAWRMDDTSRPQSLPSITKHWSFPSNIERHLGFSQHRDMLSFPLSCPICYEDLDPTDSSFLPCSCGFHLCLFCHKRILEADGRCPGCRKKYELNGGEIINWNKVGGTVLPYGLPRSCSMNSRS